jgi:hypothetical protein
MRPLEASNICKKDKIECFRNDVVFFMYRDWVGATMMALLSVHCTGPVAQNQQNPSGRAGDQL